MIMKVRVLKYAGKVNPNGLLRLAMFLKLKTDGMSMNQIAKLIHWRITRQDMK